MRQDPSVETNSPTGLSPDFLTKVEELRRRLLKESLEMRFGTTLRGPIVQAKMWCRSRSVEQIENMARTLTIAGAPTMGSMLRPELAGLGPHCTKSLPGQSWHQYGEAIDAYFYVGGIALWDSSPAHRACHIAEEIGLHGGLKLIFGKRPYHIQLRKEDSPLLIQGFADGWSHVEKKMKEAFEL